MKAPGEGERDRDRDRDIKTRVRAVSLIEVPEETEGDELQQSFNWVLLYSQANNLYLSSSLSENPDCIYTTPKFQPFLTSSTIVSLGQAIFGQDYTSYFFHLCLLSLLSTQ